MGNGNTISNVNLNDGSDEDADIYNAAGLFGYVKNGTINNVHVSNVNIVSASGNVAGIAGKIEGASISNCTASGTISGQTYSGSFDGKTFGGIVGSATSSKIEGCTNNTSLISEKNGIGGIVGLATNSTEISGCVNNAAIQGGCQVGGIVGSLQTGSISSCINNGAVSLKGAETHVFNESGFGGIVGVASQSSLISECENNGTVTAVDQLLVGGIAGTIRQGSDIHTCTNTGNVTGSENVGGIVGAGVVNSSSSGDEPYYSVSGCSNTGVITGTTNVGGIIGSSAATVASISEKGIEIINNSNSGSVQGTTNVGGIVGINNNASSTDTTAVATQVTGNLNTGNVPEGAGTIVGNNNGTDATVGVVQNNFWPEELGTNAYWQRSWFQWIW